VVATEKRRPDTHGGDARPNHSTVGQERRPSVVIGTIPRYLRPKAVLVFAAEIEARGGTEWWIRPGATGESAHLSHRVSSHILDSEIITPRWRARRPRGATTGPIPLRTVSFDGLAVCHTASTRPSA